MTDQMPDGAREPRGVEREQQVGAPAAHGARAPRGGDAGAPPVDERQNSYTISVAARLTGMHPQTLRQYDRLGLVSPHRTSGRGRRYTNRDLVTLRLVQTLSQEAGINLAGIKQILELRAEVEQLRATLRKLEARVDSGGRVFAVDTKGAVFPMARGRRLRRPGGELVLWKRDISH